MILEGKKILITGIVNRHSIAFSIAERAQAQGAEVLLTSFGRVKRMTERSAARLDPVPEVLELDVNSDEDAAALRDPATFSADGLHPSSAGHQTVARETAKYLTAKLGIEFDMEKGES